MNKNKCVLAGLLLLLSSFGLANPPLKPLPVEQAFVTSAELFGDDTIVLSWKIAPRHYLYRERFHFNVTYPNAASIGNILLPPGEFKEDGVFGKYQIYAHAVSIPLPIIHPNLEKTQVTINYQGCSEDGYCYPPTAKLVSVNFVTRTIKIDPINTSVNKSNTQQEQFVGILAHERLFTTLLAFLGFGILLSFTPCVLPMLPILSGIILGHKDKMTAGKAFRLSVVYVLSMSLTYAIAGIFAALLGSSIQSAFQKPWVIILFSLFFVVLALSFFGFYHIRIPARLEERISNVSRHQRSGHYISVAIMGCLATLIVSPCVTPALVGVLTYIGQTGNAFLGGIVLFTLAFGMGIPIIIAGTAGGKLLPKAGMWMTTLEHSFGVLFLGLAIWMLQRILPEQVTLLLWAALFMVSAIYMGAFAPTSESGWNKLWKGVGLVLFSYGILMLVGAAQGNGNPLQPLRVTALPQERTVNKPLFTRVTDLAAIKQAIDSAKMQHKSVVIDFYADWCISCKEMEQGVFQDPKVRAALQQVVALQVDVTENNQKDKSVMQYFNVIAPPTMLFFNAQGQWLSDKTLVGEIKSEQLLKQLGQTGL